jgi:DNA (cytosine-5)-methyltransferase 1
MNELALFAGAGGGILGGHLLGWRTVCAVEWEAYPASVLVARQNDKILPSFPIWDDVQTFDGKPWRGIVDVVSGGFPCQDISAAGGGLELTEKEVVCGERWQGLLARLDPNTHLWKIPQCSLLEDSEQSLETWSNWGTMRNGVCWEQMMWEQTTTENEFGYWATPTAGLSKHGASLGYWQNRIAKGRQSDTHMEVLKKMWGTPKAQDSRHASWDRGKSNLGEQVAGLHNGGHLNPVWTEWLMGWPLEWTDLKPLEMDKSHFVQQQPGQS